MLPSQQSYRSMTHQSSTTQYSALPTQTLAQATTSKVASNVCECMHVLAHDPSMALYRLHEHVHKSLPSIVDRKADSIKLQAALQGGCFDVGNAIDTVNSMCSSGSTFERIREKLRSAMAHKQALDYHKAKTASLRVSESSDSLASSVHKARSYAHLPRSVSMADSQVSRSTLSTPTSQHRGAAAATPQMSLTDSSGGSSITNMHTLREPSRGDVTQVSSANTSGPNTPDELSDEECKEDQ